MNIKHDSCFELLATLYAIAQQNLINRLLKSKSINTSSINFNNMLEKLIKELPPDMYTSINHYFDLHGIGYIIYNTCFKYLHNYQSSPDLETFVDELKQLQYEETLTYLTTSNYGLEFSDLHENTIHSVLSEVVKTYPHPDPKRKKNILKALSSKDYINTLISTVESFYKLYAKLMMNQVTSLGIVAAKRYEKLYLEDSGGFLKRFNIPLATQSSQLIHISIFAPLGVNIYQSKWQDVSCYLIGELQDQVYRSMTPIDQIAYFHKVLSDPKRIELIKLLSQKPYYGQELAQTLNLATSTTSYHINLLNDLGLLKSTREHKKVYYTFDNNAFDLILVNQSSFIFEKQT